MSDPEFMTPTIVAAVQDSETICSQLDQIGLRAVQLIMEPAPRNTAAAIAVAALSSSPDDLLLIMPSDHLITDVKAFHTGVQKAASLASAGWLVTFGIRPTRPDTGYGYIYSGAEIEAGMFHCERFVEKPNSSSARTYMEDGRYLWNGGIFLAKASSVVDAMTEFASDILEGARKALEMAQKNPDKILLPTQSWVTVRPQSFDIAVMERAENVAVVPVEMGWSDIGSWDALYELALHGHEGNVLSGEVSAIDARGCLIRAETGRVVAIGIRDLIVVVTGNDVLIVPRNQTQRVKEAVELVSAPQAKFALTAAEAVHVIQKKSA